MRASKSANERFIESSIQLVRIGSFIPVFQNQESLKRLRELAVQPDWLGWQSRAILAEIYDQVGAYDEAGELATPEIGKAQLDALGREVQKKDPARHFVRAHTWLLLQCALSQFRRKGGQKDALALLESTIKLIDANKGEALSSQHIQSLLYFWRGRIHTSSYAFTEAEKDFKLALKVADRTLREKLQKAEESNDEDVRVRERQRQASAGNYVLSACLGFGLGQLRQIEGRILDSLQLLSVAVPLSRGSGDFHRRGYAHMLMGTALRSQNDLDAADIELQEAERLLGGGDGEDIPQHRLHLARVYHQRALSQYNRVPADGETSKYRLHLEEAKRLNERAESLSGHPSYAGYHDPLLDYGIKVAHSLVRTALRDFTAAVDFAQQAIGMFHDLPRGAHGWATVAKGMAWAEQVRGSGDTGWIRDAENAFGEVIKADDVRVIDRAAAHLHLSRLYSKIGQPLKAAVHYDRAELLAKDSEHGWIQGLSEVAKRELRTSLGPELNLNVKDLMTAGREKNVDVWPYIADFVDTEVKKRVIWLSRETLAKEDGPAKMAQELGLARATIFNWKRHPELKDLFPDSDGKRRRRTKR